ncbi:MAG TPA: hypothetical protein VFM88_23255 [Vicinamibacteria bacterium]|nr:hypothetical protein [Vicinamibacteria bacterium]
MAISVKRVTLWRASVDNRPGALARILAGQAAAGASLEVVMGYAVPGEHAHAVVEIHPVKAKKAMAAAQAAGLSASSTPTLLVSGDDRPGLGHAMAQALGDAGINLSFMVAQVVGRRYSAVFGFESEADAGRAAGLIKKAAARKK